MPAFLPLSLVLDIVDRSLARDFFDEDWAAYLARLAKLCRVCKAMRDLVKPVLWTTVRFKSTRQLAKLRPPQKANRATRQLYKDYPPLLPQRRYLRDLTLENYHIQDIQPNLVLPNLKTLSLVRIFALDETLTKLFSPRCTPNLKHAFLSRFKFINEAHDAETYTPLDKLNLRRLDAVQIDPSNLILLPQDLRQPGGPCGTQTKLLLSWQAPTTRFHPTTKLPEYFQLNIPDAVYTDKSLEPYFEAMMRNIAYAVEDGYGFEAVFLPERLSSPSNLAPWLRPSVKFFLQTCFDLFVPVIFYHGESVASSTMSAKFLDYIRSPTDDENPLTVEAKLSALASDEPNRWTNAVGLEVEEWEDEEEEIDQDESDAIARDFVDQIVNLPGNGPVVVYINI